MRALPKILVEPMPPKLEDDIKRLNMIAPVSWVKKVDDWRRQQPELPNLSEAIRRLVEMGLEHATRGSPRGRSDYRSK